MFCSWQRESSKPFPVPIPGYLMTSSLFEARRKQLDEFLHELVDKRNDGRLGVKFGYVLARFLEVDEHTNTTDAATALFQAVSERDLNVVQELLDRSAEAVHQSATGGGTAMHLAAFQGYSDCVELLLHAGGNVNAQMDQDSSLPLHLATINGHTECVQQLLDAGSLVDGQMKDGTTALAIAAAHGHEQVLTQLLEAYEVATNASIHTGDNGGDSGAAAGFTALHHAARGGIVAVAAQLLQAGARADGVTAAAVASGAIGTAAAARQAAAKTTTPLALAASCGHVEMMRMLIDAGALACKVVNSRLSSTDTQEDDEDEGAVRVGGGALTVGAAAGHERCVKLLLDSGVSPCADDEMAKQTTGTHAVDIVAAVRARGVGGGGGVCSSLVPYSIQPSPRLGIFRWRDKPHTPPNAVYASAANGHLTVMRMLLQHGVSINAYAPDGTTPLWAAVRFGRLECVQALLELGGCNDTIYSHAPPPDELAGGNAGGIDAGAGAAKEDDAGAVVGALSLGNGGNDGSGGSGESTNGPGGSHSRMSSSGGGSGGSSSNSKRWCMGFTALDVALYKGDEELVSLLRAAGASAPSMEPTSLVGKKICVQGRVGLVLRYHGFDKRAAKKAQQVELETREKMKGESASKGNGMGNIDITRAATSAVKKLAAAAKAAIAGVMKAVLASPFTIRFTGGGGGGGGGGRSDGGGRSSGKLGDNSSTDSSTALIKVDEEYLAGAGKGGAEWQEEKLVLLRMDNGGLNWSLVEPLALDPALSHEVMMGSFNSAAAAQLRRLVQHTSDSLSKNPEGGLSPLAHMLRQLQQQRDTVRAAATAQSTWRRASIDPYTVPERRRRGGRQSGITGLFVGSFAKGGEETKGGGGIDEEDDDDDDDDDVEAAAAAVAATAGGDDQTSKALQMQLLEELAAARMTIVRVEAEKQEMERSVAATKEELQDKLRLESVQMKGASANAAAQAREEVEMLTKAFEEERKKAEEKGRVAQTDMEAKVAEAQKQVETARKAREAEGTLGGEREEGLRAEIARLQEKAAAHTVAMNESAGKLAEVKEQVCVRQRWFVRVWFVRVCMGLCCARARMRLLCCSVQSSRLLRIADSFKYNICPPP
jgi:ankyrin repeat protein